MTGTGGVSGEAEQERILAAVTVGAQWLERLGEAQRQQLPMLVFQCVVEATRTQAAAGVPIEKIQFEAKELSTKLSEHTGKTVTDPARQIRTLWERLTELLENDAEILAAIAHEQGLGWIPRLDKSESPGGRQRHSYYSLACEPAPTEDVPAHTHTEAPPGGIVYRMRSLKRPPLYLRWLDGLELLRGGGWFLSALLVIGLVYLIGISWLSLYLLVRIEEDHLELIVIALTLVAVPWIILGPFYRVLHHRIIPVPNWWLLLRVDEHQLQYARTVSGEQGGKGHRRLHLVSYTATCPRCAGQVSLTGGGIRWWGRLVGRCHEAPREHIFTFDHVTRIGERLR